MSFQHDKVVTTLPNPHKGNNYERAKQLINLFHFKDSMRFDFYILCQLVPSSSPFFFNFLQFYFVCVCVSHWCLRIILCLVVNDQKKRSLHRQYVCFWSWRFWRQTASNCAVRYQLILGKVFPFSLQINWEVEQLHLESHRVLLNIEDQNLSFILMTVLINFKFLWIEVFNPWKTQLKFISVKFLV